MGRGRGGRDGDRLPHRHRRRRPGRRRSGAPAAPSSTTSRPTYGGQYAAMKLVAGGALDRHPDLKVLISEGGATWVPFIGDRMNEALPPARHVRPPAAGAACRRRSSTARSTRASSTTRRRRPRCWAMGYQQRDVRQRLPAPGGHVRPHPEDAARAVRRCDPRGPRPNHAGRVRGAVPPRVPAPCLRTGSGSRPAATPGAEPGGRRRPPMPPGRRPTRCPAVERVGHHRCRPAAG